MTLKVGEWIYQRNGINGNVNRARPYAPYQIVGETRVSWLLDNGDKANKKTLEVSHKNYGPSRYVTAEDRDRLLWLSENKSRIVRAVSDCFDPVILRRVDDALKVGVFVRPEGDISAAVEVLGPGTIERIDT